MEVETIRHELDELRRRIDEMETRLDTRIAAEENKRASDVELLNRKWTDIVVGLASNTRTVANLADQQRASHYALVHLLAVTARHVRVPDADLNEAMRIAKEVMPP